MKIHLRNFLLGLMAGIAVLLATQIPVQAFISINVGIAPPPLPLAVYAQPACPGDGYIWTPGYWAWNADLNQYEWVPGEWVLAPEIGCLWTPAWWAWNDGGYCFHPGYWGRDVGFYGGIDYGHGYNGHGYHGGYWGGGHFYYNRNVNNVGAVASSHVYSRAVATNNDRVSFNGGRGGVAAGPTAAEVRAGRESHFGETTAQAAHVRAVSASTSGRFAAHHVTGNTAAGTNAPAFRASNAAGMTHNASHYSSAVHPAIHTGFASEQPFTGTSTGTRNYASESHHATREMSSFRPESHVAAPRSHFSSSPAPAFHGRSFHAQSFHPQSFHAQSFHAQSFHASAVHASAPRGGGNGGGGHGSHR